MQDSHGRRLGSGAGASRRTSSDHPAAEATILFNGGDFDGAMSLLERLARESGGAVDARVVQNMALARFAKTDGRGAQRLLADLSAITDPSAGESKASTAIDTGVDQGAVRYNTAVAMYSLRMFASAQRVLEGMVGDVMTPVEGLAAARASFLLLDVYAAGLSGAMRSDQAASVVREKAQQLFERLEKPSRFNDSASGASAELQADFKFRLHLAKARMDMLVGNEDGVKDSLQTALEVVKSTQSRSRDNDRAGLSMWSPERTFLGDSRTKELAALVVKAQLECQRQKHERALRLLASCTTSEPGLDRSLYLNNLGCLYSQLKRDHAAALHFARALEASVEHPGGQFYASPAGSAFTVKPPSQSCAMNYNSGIALLRLNRGAAAFQCFQKAAQMFRQRPRLWLRMAEACIAQYEQDRKAAVAACDVKSTSWAAAGVVSGVQGEGRLRRLQLAVEDGVSTTASGCSIEASCTMEYAAQCLRACLALLQDDDVVNIKGSAPTSAATPDQRVLQAALCKLAYVSLIIGDPLTALESSRRLLENEHSREPWKYRCRLYATEALCKLNHPSGADAYLNQPVLVELSTRSTSPDAPGAPVNEGSLTVADATAALFVNLSTAYVLRDNFNAALQCARQALVAAPSSVEARRLSVYLSLRCGKQRGALALLKLGQLPETTARPAGGATPAAGAASK